MTITQINTDSLTSKVELIKVSSRGQIVIPEDIRKKYGIKQGDRLILLEQDGALLLTKASTAEDVLRKQWLSATERSFADVWDNDEDDKIWNNA